MIIITFVMVCEMEWSYKIRYHRDFEYIPSSPPSLGIIQTKVGIQQFSTSCICEFRKSLKFDRDIFFGLENNVWFHSKVCFMCLVFTGRVSTLNFNIYLAQFKL